MTGTDVMMRWGTWEELVLGGAVHRHGIRAWDAVAEELRARTLYSCCFTAEVCKAKYEDLQDRYCGCTALFEELRKQRVAELKRELEKSEDSIGSLESKLENLKAEKGKVGHVKYDSDQTESPVSVGNSEGAEFSGKDISKDGLSASSFTEETRTNWSTECQIPAAVSTQETEIKLEEREKTTSVETFLGGGGGSVRKRRGKRKRKDCSKEGSVGDSDVLSSAVEGRDKEESTGDCDRSVRSSDRDDHKGHSGGEKIVDLIEILNSFMENENASVFRRRLESQKRARYKKTIRRHLDFDAIRSRISDRSITSARELFRDLLLLSNNAMVFYPKNSREYNSAVSLRDLATKTFRLNQRVSGSDSGAAAADITAKPPVCDPPVKSRTNQVQVETPVESPGCSPPVKPRSTRPCNRKVAGKASAEATPTPESKKARDAEFRAESSVVVVKKGVGRPGKLGRGSSCKRPETPAKGRKRPWRR